MNIINQDFTVLFPDHLRQILYKNDDDIGGFHYVYSKTLLSTNCLIEYVFDEDDATHHIDPLENEDSGLSVIGIFIAAVTNIDNELRRYPLCHHSPIISTIEISRIIVDIAAVLERQIKRSGSVLDQLDKIAMGYVTAQKEKTKKRRKERHEEEQEVFAEIISLINGQENMLN